jgi:hypothetical protein
MVRRWLLCWSQPTAKVSVILQPCVVQTMLLIAAAAAAAVLQYTQALAAVLESTYSQGERHFAAVCGADDAQSCWGQQQQQRQQVCRWTGTGCCAGVK